MQNNKPNSTCEWEARTAARILQMAQLQNRFTVSKYWDVFLFAESELESPHAVSTNGESGIGYRVQVGMCKVIPHIGAEYV